MCAAAIVIIRTALSRKKHRLAAGRKRLENFPEFAARSPYQASVGLVEDDDADGVKAKSPLIQVVNETAGRRDDNVGISRESDVFADPTRGRR